MADNTDVQEQGAGLKHIYFFIDDNASDQGSNAHSIGESSTETSIESLPRQSRTSSPGSNKAESMSTVTTASCSELNPLAPTFKPKSDAESKSSAVPPAPSASQIFELRQTTDKGLGLFASTAIKRGTLILQEKPLLKIDGMDVYLAWGPYSRLGNAEKAAFDTLHAYHPQDLNLEHASRVRLIDPTDASQDEDDVEENVADHVRVMSIFAANNFEIKIPKAGLAVYATASRINHSCVPNVHHSWNPSLRSITLYAIQDIQRDEELFISYIGGVGCYQAHGERLHSLRTKYGFTCACVACTDPTSASDGRRELMNSFTWGLNEYNEGAPASHPFIPASAAAALRQAEDLIGVMLTENLVAIELTKAYRMASTYALRLKDYDKAVEYSRNEAEIERNSLGTQLSDLRKLGVASELWFDEVIETIRKDVGEGVAQKYRNAARAEKKKLKKRQWTGKKKSRSRARSNGVQGSDGSHAANA